jgi:hypothetical protein
MKDWEQATARTSVRVVFLPMEFKNTGTASAEQEMTQAATT